MISGKPIDLLITSADRTVPARAATSICAMGLDETLTADPHSVPDELLTLCSTEHRVFQSWAVWQAVESVTELAQGGDGLVDGFVADGVLSHL